MSDARRNAAALGGPRPAGYRELIARRRQLELDAQQAEIATKTADRRHYPRMRTWLRVGRRARRRP